MLLPGGIWVPRRFAPAQPGPSDLRLPAADHAFTRAGHIVGYGPALDRIAQTGTRATRHVYPAGEEHKACRKALDLATIGQEVVLTATGEAGFDAVAGLIWDLVADATGPASYVAIELIPAISSMQAAASLTGAPLAHDFCVVSLGDPSISWPQIETRLAAAAAGDFVLVLRRLVNRKRKKSLIRMREIMLTSRGPETPVIVARDGATPEVIRLDALSPAHGGPATVLIVGAASSRAVAFAGGTAVYTPRGFAPAPDKEAAE